MKKLMIAALGLAFALSTVSFAAPGKQTETTPKKKGKKKSTAPKM